MNVISHINRLKNKNHILSQQMQKKHLKNIQDPFLIKIWSVR
jgi:hypothetical protein